MVNAPTPWSPSPQAFGTLAVRLAISPSSSGLPPSESGVSPNPNCVPCRSLPNSPYAYPHTSTFYLAAGCARFCALCAQPLRLTIRGISRGGNPPRAIRRPLRSTILLQRWIRSPSLPTTRCQIKSHPAALFGSPAWSVELDHRALQRLAAVPAPPSPRSAQPGLHRPRRTLNVSRGGPFPFRLRAFF